MDKTLFELVPVSVKPEKEGWYWVQNESNNKYFRNSAKYEDGAWWDYLDVGNGLIEVYNITHYLRPLPPPVAEERTEKMWLDIVHSVVAGYERMKMPFEVAEELKKQFHITKK